MKYKWKSILSLLTVFLTTILAQSYLNLDIGSSLNEKFEICSFSRTAYDTCDPTTEFEDEELFVDLPPECVRKYTAVQCVDLVKEHKADMAILTEYQYEAAWRAGLKPVIHDNEADNVYLAVAPNDIIILDKNGAVITVNNTDASAYHAAAFYNLRRSRDLCRIFNKNGKGAYVSVTNTANYFTKNNEIHQCPDHTWCIDYSTCQELHDEDEDDLHSAVFMQYDVASYVLGHGGEEVAESILYYLITDRDDVCLLL